MALQSIEEAAKTGSRRATLEALRDKLAASIDECESGRDVAALSRRLMDVCEILDTLPVEDEDAKSPLDLMRDKYGRG